MKSMERRRSSRKGGKKLLVFKDLEQKNTPKIGEKIRRYPNLRIVVLMYVDDKEICQVTKKKSILKKKRNVKFNESLCFEIPNNVERVKIKIESWHQTSLLKGTSENRLIGKTLSFHLDVESLKTETSSKNFVLPLGTRNFENKKETILSFKVQYNPKKDGKYDKSLKRSERMMKVYEKLKKHALVAATPNVFYSFEVQLDEETRNRFAHFRMTTSRTFKNLRVFYIHGLESSPQGPKPQFLTGKVRCVQGMDMDISCYKLSKGVNFPKYFLKTLLSREMVRGLENGKYILKKMVDVCVKKQTEELEKYPHYFDLYIGSSWGGAVLIELLRKLNVIPFDSMILLLAPAQNLVNPSFEVSEAMREKYRFVKLVHGEKDEIVNVKYSRQLDQDFGENCDYEEIKGARHSLKNLLHDGTGGIEDIIHKMVLKRNQVFEEEYEDEGEVGDEEENEGEVEDFFGSQG